MSPSTLFLWILSSAIYLTLPVRGLGKTVAPEILVKPNIWGGASTQDIEQVLNSTARQIWPYMPQGSRATIQVERSRTGPIVLFRRGERGEYLVRLDTEKTFGHNMPSNLPMNWVTLFADIKKEIVPTYGLRKPFAKQHPYSLLRDDKGRWNESNPPYPNWKSYGTEFAQICSKTNEQTPMVQ